MQFVVQTEHGIYQLEAQDFEIDKEEKLTFFNTYEGIDYDVWEADKYLHAFMLIPGAGWVSLEQIQSSMNSSSVTEEKG